MIHMPRILCALSIPRVSNVHVRVHEEDERHWSVLCFFFFFPHSKRIIVLTPRIPSLGSRFGVAKCCLCILWEKGKTKYLDFPPSRRHWLIGFIALFMKFGK